MALNTTKIEQLNEFIARFAAGTRTDAFGPRRAAVLGLVISVAAGRSIPVRTREPMYLGLALRVVKSRCQADTFMRVRSDVIWSRLCSCPLVALCVALLRGVRQWDLPCTTLFLEEDTLSCGSRR